MLATSCPAFPRWLQALGLCDITCNCCATLGIRPDYFFYYKKQLVMATFPLA